MNSLLSAQHMLHPSSFSLFVSKIRVMKARA
jgi:hypothetical protein